MSNKRSQGETFHDFMAEINSLLYLPTGFTIMMLSYLRSHNSILMAGLKY
ncbi:MAG: hypothetical protein K0S76_155 [Herbinix sp.]|jgi:hypothetical protein|nr:hypothetical protein [Herbinix sp.]